MDINIHNMKPKTFIKEILLVALLLVAVIIIFWVATSVKFGNSPFDIELHDLYFSIAGKMLVLPAFLLVSMVVYLIKEAFYKYQRRIQNIILLISTFGVNVYVLFFLKFLAILFSINCGGTVYPPLSAMHDSRPLMSSSSFDNRLTTLFYIQLIFLVILVFVSILAGNSLNNTKNEHQVS